jgi:FixJ family two-component response regulator
MDEPRTLVVYVVDDDPAVRDSLSLLLSLKGYNTKCFASAQDFLASARAGMAGCIMADVRMPGMSGLEMQEELQRRAIELPVVVITAHGSVAAARRAFKAQAVDFLEKPFDEDGPVQAVEAAFARERMRLASLQAMERKTRLLSSLTTRERQVVSLLVRGLHHAQIGDELGISPRTIEVHKARIMAKLGIRSVAELVQVALDPPPKG